jgi:hypothetical protein
MLKLSVFLVLAAVLAVNCAVHKDVPPGMCPGNRDDLLSCFSELADANKDGNITKAEIADMYVQKKACFPVQQQTFFDFFTPDYIMNNCDVNGDGVLNLVDWNDANACARSRNYVNYLCRLCYTCRS